MIDIAQISLGLFACGVAGYLCGRHLPLIVAPIAALLSGGTIGYLFVAPPIIRLLGLVP